MTILGTRPEIIRLSLIIPMLDRETDHVLVHTGQNYDERLDALFFRELGVRDPDIRLGVRADGFGAQVGQILAGVEAAILERRPDRVLILGDTNSGLSAIVARRLGIPVYHMEAGNRCYDERVPEEVNRRTIDHASTILLPYTGRSRDNLVREGIAPERVYVTGNPIHQVMKAFSRQIDASNALPELGLRSGEYFLVTLHRAENVDRADRLRDILGALGDVAEEHSMPVICSVHPRTRSRAAKHGCALDDGSVRYLEPLGFFDFLRLERSAACILTDSGTVQEEACILGVPAVTMREVTERPETVECGSNLVVGTAAQDIVDGVRLAMRTSRRWAPPSEYLADRVSETVLRIMTGFRPPDAAEVEWRTGARL